MYVYTTVLQQAAAISRRMIETITRATTTKRYRGTVVRVDAAAMLWSSGPGECRRITCTGVCARDVLGAAESTTRYAHTHTRRPCIDVPTATDGDRVMDGREIVSEL